MDAAAVDFRELLLKYIVLVGEAEGVSFIPRSRPDWMTQSEFEALQVCDQETGERWYEIQGKEPPRKAGSS